MCVNGGEGGDGQQATTDATRPAGNQSRQRIAPRKDLSRMLQGE